MSIQPLPLKLTSNICRHLHCVRCTGQVAAVCYQCQCVRCITIQAIECNMVCVIGHLSAGHVMVVSC